MEDAGEMLGGCLCGQVRYSILGAPIYVTQCCCKDCQKATGTGHTTIIRIHESQLKIRSGQLAVYTCKGDTGGQVHRHFCGTCGGRIYTSGDAPGAEIMVQAGSLDQPDQVTPSSVIYVKDRVAWDRTDPALPHFDILPRSFPRG
jgi:hypothetical protein